MNAGFSYFHADQRGSWHTCLEKLDKVGQMAMIRGVLGWSNQQKEAMSARAKRVGFSPTQAHSDSEQKLRKLKGGTRPGRLGRLPENFLFSSVDPNTSLVEQAVESFTAGLRVMGPVSYFCEGESPLDEVPESASERSSLCRRRRLSSMLSMIMVVPLYFMNQR